MFWTDDTNNRIWRAKLNGTGASIMISTRLNCPGWTITIICDIFCHRKAFYN